MSYAEVGVTAPAEGTWAPESEGLSRRDLLTFLFKHQTVILLTFLLVSLVVGAGLASLPPTYVAQAKLLVKVEQQGSPSFLSGITAYREPHEADAPNRKLETEMAMVTARPLSEEVVRKLGLQYEQVYRAPYIYLAEPLLLLWDRLNAWMKGVPLPADRHGFSATVKEFNRALEVQTPRSKVSESPSNLIEVSLKAPDPVIAQQALAVLLERYIQMGAVLDQESGNQALEIVRAALEQARAKVSRSETELHGFLARSGVTLQEAARGSAGSTAQAQAQAEPGADERPATGGTAEPQARHGVSPVSQESILSMLKLRLSKAELELAEARGVFTDRSERVLALGAEVRELKRRLQQETQKVADDEIRGKTLLRNLADAEASFLELRKKYDQIHLFLEMSPSQVYTRAVVEPPLLPHASEWRRTALIGALASLAGLVLGLALAAASEYADHRLRSGAEITRHLGIPVFATIPMVQQAALHNALTGPLAVPRRNE